MVFLETKGKELSLANHYKCPCIPLNQSELEVTLLGCVKRLGTLPEQVIDSRLGLVFPLIGQASCAKCTMERNKAFVRFLSSLN